MKHRNLIFSTVLLVVMACNSEEKKQETVSITDSTDKPVDTAAMNKAWAEYMAPGEVHKMLAKFNGQWEAEIAFYYNPDSPSVSKILAETKMILGGRYQQSTYKGKIDGMPFEGISTLAYDNARKIYLSTWIDNMGTGIMQLAGVYDEASKTINFMGNATDVGTGKDIAVREIFKIGDHNMQTMEMYETEGGKEMKTMSILLKRK